MASSTEFLNDPGLKLEDRNGSFTISFRNRVLFLHSPDSPCIELARGRGRFGFHYGLFKIRDRKSRRMPCRSYRVTEQRPGLVKIEFEIGLSMRLESVHGRLHAEFKSADKSLNRFWINWQADKEEKVYGGGEQYSRLNLRGSNLPIWVQEPGLGRGFDLLTILTELKTRYGGSWHTTYFSQPTFVFTSGMFVHCECSAYTVGMFKKRHRHTLHTWDIPDRIIFGVEENPSTLMESLTSYLGRQPRLPSWAYDGMWLGAQGGREITRQKLEKVKKAGVKVGGLWCQDWEGVRITSFGKQLMWNWSYDSQLYPDLPEYIRELNKEGIRYLGYINPFLALEGELYKIASEQGYCVKDSAGDDYLVTITTFPAAMLDLTNSECRNWIKNVIKDNMIGTGLSGWMADYGEYIPVDAVFHDGSDGLTYHNRYVTDWARVNREAVLEAGKDGEIAFFMRSGYTGSTGHSPGFWNGDQLVNWSRHQGFPTVIPGSLSLGFTGAGYVHSDIGGFTTVLWLKRSRELVMRWAEQAAFTQTMRSHEGNRPNVGASLHDDEILLSHLARMTNVFTALKPYHQALSDEYQEKGLPPVRHPWIHYSGDTEVHHRRCKYQYMYGPDLMVAPVVYKGRRSRRLYLPEDQWIHLWTGKEYTGGWVRVSSPVGAPAVFYRKKSSWIDLFKELKLC